MFLGVRMMTPTSSGQSRTSRSLVGPSNGTLLGPASRNQQVCATWRARLLALCVAAALVTGCGDSSVPPPPAQPPSQGDQNCAWPSMYSVQSTNTAFPDSAASYWGQPIVADKNTTIQISGRFPD